MQVVHVAVEMAPIAKVGGMRCLLLGCHHTNMRFVLLHMLQVVHVAVEMAPIAKVGGMGDVVTALARAVQEEGHTVEVVVPKYDVISYHQVRHVALLLCDVCNTLYRGYRRRSTQWWWWCPSMTSSATTR
jgi:glycogen synthase